MLFGLTGPSSSGKTTLAKRLAEDLGIEFYETSSNEVCKNAGFDPHAPMSLADRVKLQGLLLDNHIKTLEERPRPLIVDRTPLDMLAFLSCEFHMNSHLDLDPAVLQQADDLAERCLTQTALKYDTIFYLSPLEFVIDPNKPRPAVNPMYQRHFRLIVQGGLTELEGRVNWVSLDDPDPEWRNDYVHDVIVARLDELQKMRTSAEHVH
jgi:DNA polymerase III delta prime subunit